MHKSDDGNEELFHFYRDENASPPPAEDDLPQYLDDNIEVFDPASAIVTNDFKSAKAGGGGFLRVMSIFVMGGFV